jgi:nitroreductase
MLQAVSMGLGTCVIGSAVGALNLPEVKAEIGVPEDFRAIAPIVVGVPAAATQPSARRDPQLLAWV